jgi:hypothetical protein
MTACRYSRRDRILYGQLERHQINAVYRKVTDDGKQVLDPRWRIYYPKDSPKLQKVVIGKRAKLSDSKAIALADAIKLLKGATNN